FEREPAILLQQFHTGAPRAQERAIENVPSGVDLSAEPGGCFHSVGEDSQGTYAAQHRVVSARAAPSARPRHPTAAPACPCCDVTRRPTLAAVSRRGRSPASPSTPALPPGRSSAAGRSRP